MTPGDFDEKLWTLIGMVSTIEMLHDEETTAHLCARLVEIRDELSTSYSTIWRHQVHGFAVKSRDFAEEVHREIEGDPQ